MNSSNPKMQIQNIGKPAPVPESGTVLRISDGIARIHGLAGVMAGERIEFTGHGGERVDGLALHLERESVVAALFGHSSTIKAGDTVNCTGRLMDVPVGEALLGRVVNALGIPMDDKGPVATIHRDRVERKGPGVVHRQGVKEPILTGIKAIDVCVPISRGQRKAIVGDRGTGKTALAVDAILNQKDKGVFCIYVAIGQSLAEVRRIADRLESLGAMKHTTIVAACANEVAVLQYLAPFTGTTMGEYFRDCGRDALCVYDDLSKHAIAYRQVSLLLGQLPGRELYPSDIFSLQSRLLERSAKMANVFYVVKKGTVVKGGDVTYRGVDGKAHFGELGRLEVKDSAYALVDKDTFTTWKHLRQQQQYTGADKLEKKLSDELGASDYEIVKEPDSGGSLTALPIVETQAGDVSAYIPASILSIADGQIFLASDDFLSGVRPAIDLMKSTNVDGNHTQIKALKRIVGFTFKLLSSFYYTGRALAEFAQFSRDLDARTQAMLDRHARFVELMKQDAYAPLAIEQQCLILFALTRGLLNDIPVSEIRRFEKELFVFMNAKAKRVAVMRAIAAEKRLDDDDTLVRMMAAIEAFKKRFTTCAALMKKLESEAENAARDEQERLAQAQAAEDLEAQAKALLEKAAALKSKAKK